MIWILSDLPILRPNLFLMNFYVLTLPKSSLTNAHPLPPALNFIHLAKRWNSKACFTNDTKQQQSVLIKGYITFACSWSKLCFFGSSVCSCVFRRCRPNTIESKIYWGLIVLLFISNFTRYSLKICIGWWFYPRTSLEMDGTLDFDCFHLGANF